MRDTLDTLSRIEKRLTRLQAGQDTILRLTAITLTFQGKIMSALSELQAAVASEDTVIDSAITLIEGIPALIAAAGTDAAALAALQADIAAHATALSAAVVANTPAAAPTPAPTV